MSTTKSPLEEGKDQYVRALCLGVGRSRRGWGCPAELAQPEEYCYTGRRSLAGSFEGTGFN